MKWKRGRRSRNLEDRRGQRTRSPFPFRFPTGRPRGGGMERAPAGGRRKTRPMALSLAASKSFSP